jgi:signal peptidase I
MTKRDIFEEYVKPLIIAILIALFIRTFIVQAFRIPSSSMEPTLQVGDFILVSKIIYGVKIPFTDKKLFEFTKPKRGDIVVFIYPKNTSQDFIKRVIGTEGDKVEVVGRKVYVNDRQIDDPWGYYSDKNDWVKAIPGMERSGPWIVPKNSLFVLGDNRDNSQDSRYWGFVTLNAVKGKAFIVYFSWNSLSENLFGKIRWGRLARILH